MFGTIPDTWMRLHWRVELGTPPPAHPFRVYNFKEQPSWRKALLRDERSYRVDPVSSTGPCCKEAPYTPPFSACQILMLSFFTRPIKGMEGRKD